MLEDYVWLLNLTVWCFGLFTFAQCCIGFAQYINKNLIRRPLDLTERYGKRSWAVITGATGGIGEEFCKQLAEKEFNIVLMSRNKERLEASEKRIKLCYPMIETRIIQADFSESMTPEFYQNINAQLEDLDISILVNNAGIYPVNYFEMLSAQEIKDMIQTNCCSYLFLSHCLLKKLVSRDKRGAIINISSRSGVSPLFYLGGYSATKRFVSFMSYMLHNMFKDKIDIINIAPASVSTKMIGNKKGTYICSPKICVEGSLRDLGYDVDSTPHWLHAIQVHILQTTYRFLRPVWYMNSKKFVEGIILERLKKTQPTEL